VTAGELERLALGCLLPGFPGGEPPDWVRRLLEAGLGGIVLYAWNVHDPEQLLSLTGALRAERPELVVAIDEEGGDVTRLEARAGSSYPGNWALGVVDDVELTRAVAGAMASDLVGAGINLDFAPVADVNTTADNPIIGVRSFGSDAGLVARHVAAFVAGLEAGGVAACAKHFPGHGDTLEDSHLELPTVDTLRPEALLPFRAAIDAGVSAIMTAHIRVREVGEEPATLNRALLTDLLRDELGFSGLAITDALEMNAISATVGVEQGAVQALAAGADALCLGHDLGADSVERIVHAVVAAVRSGALADERLAEAAARTAAVVDQRQAADASDPAVGAAAARRALRTEGEVLLTRPAIVVELRPEPTIAVDARNGGLGDLLATRQPDARVAQDADAVGSGQLVVVLQDAHRHEWQRDAAGRLLEAAGDAIVVEVGLPVWRPDGAAGYVATHGAARVNVEAAVDRLLGG
jgi:beta-N-acetylhexosaminidase